MLLPERKLQFSTYINVLLPFHYSGETLISFYLSVLNSSLKIICFNDFQIRSRNAFPLVTVVTVNTGAAYGMTLQLCLEANKEQRLVRICSSNRIHGISLDTY